MLSKKQARTFFLGGTVVTFLIFIGLTVFSFSKGQDQTNSNNITAEVVRGKKLWEENNCMGCHTILGEGAYCAPELTKVIERRGKGYIKVHQNLAIIWVPFQFYLDGKFSHQGHNFFLLFWNSVHWEILYLSDTRE